MCPYHRVHTVLLGILLLASPEFTFDFTNHLYHVRLETCPPGVGGGVAQCCFSTLSTIFVKTLNKIMIIN